MAFYNSVDEKRRKNKKDEAWLGFKNFMDKSEEDKTKIPKYQLELNVWYKGYIEKIDLTQSSGKLYPTITIVYRVYDKDNKPHDLKMSHLLSNSNGTKAIKDIKKLLYILGITKEEMRKVCQITNEVEFVGYLQKYLGTRIGIKSESDKNNSYTIELLENIKELNNE